MLLAATSRAQPSATGTLGSRRRLASLTGRGRLLRRLNRVFGREADGVLALELYGEQGLVWTINDPPAFEGRVLSVERGGSQRLTFPLRGRTIADVRDALLDAGVTLLATTDDPTILALDAMALVPGGGSQYESNGTHIFARRSLLWAWAEPIGRWIDRARLDVAEMLRMLVVPQAGGGWSDLWASYFGLTRRTAETDDALNHRTQWEWRRQRNNPKAIELNIAVLLGERVTVREPWKEMMIVSGSEASGDHHLPNDAEFSYHRAQLVSATPVNWAPIMEEAEADRPAGTLYLPPVTLPTAWIITTPTPELDFGADTTDCDQIKDFDGQIISVTWTLSDTYVALNPQIAMDEELKFEAGERDVGGDLGYQRTIAKAALVASDQGPIGGLQSVISGASVPFEEGEPMMASGPRLGTFDPASPVRGLSDYVHRVTRRFVDEWAEDTRRQPSNFQPAYPPQIAMAPEQSAAGFIEHTTTALTWKGEETITISTPVAYSGGWKGQWSKRGWTAGFPPPSISMRVIFEGNGLNAAVSAISTASGSLRVGVRLAGTGAAQASGSAARITNSGAALAATAPAVASGSASTLRVGVRLDGSGAAQASGTGLLRVGVRLAGTGAAVASVGPTYLGSGPLANSGTTKANAGRAANTGATPAAGGARLSP